MVGRRKASGPTSRAKTSSKALGKRPRADKRKGKRQNQAVLDRSSKKKGGSREGPESSKLPDDAGVDLFQSSAVAAAAERKTKEEQIHTAIAGKIRKRDEDAEDAQVVVVPRKDLLELKEDRLKSRLLYGNPVCLLTTVVPRVVREQKGAAKTEEEEEDGTAEERSGAEGPARGDNEKITEGEAGMVQLADCGSRRNVMVLSWLTPVNNEGAFVCAIHKRRFSVDCLRVRGHFSLSVPVQGMEALVLKCGDITGKNVDKFRLIDGLKPVKLGTFSEDLTLQYAAKKEMRGVGGSAAGSENPFALLDGDGEAEQVERGLLGDDETAVSGCVAHLECRVVSMTDAEDGKHHLISSQALMMRAWVHPDYWNGKHFIPKRQLPALLSFIGASRFAYMRG